jgi:hypothetical protein
MVSSSSITGRGDGKRRPLEISSPMKILIERG